MIGNEKALVITFSNECQIRVMNADKIEHVDGWVYIYNKKQLTGIFNETIIDWVMFE